MIASLLVSSKIKEFRDAYRAPEVACTCLGNGDHCVQRWIMMAIAQCAEVLPATRSSEAPEAEWNDVVFLHEAGELRLCGFDWPACHDAFLFRFFTVPRIRRLSGFQLKNVAGVMRYERRILSRWRCVMGSMRGPRSKEAIVSRPMPERAATSSCVNP